MTVLWTAEDIVAATGGELQGATFGVYNISIDTRTLAPGALFVALKGERFDGHNYLTQAVQAGAVGALVSYIPENIPSGLPLIKVQDTQKALVALAKAARIRSDAKIIGITGSVGKTSAKEMLKLALELYGITYATSGNYNNHIGLPLMLANMPPATEFGIFEMGMNHAGEIDYLTNIAQPDVALITAISAAHLEFFDSVASIARAKAEIFNGLQAGGVAVLPADSEYFSLLSEIFANKCNKCRKLSFGSQANSDIQLIDYAVYHNGTMLTYRYDDYQSSFKLLTIGKHWPNVALSVLAVVVALELPIQRAEQALSKYKEQPGRGEILTIPWGDGHITVIDDSYNASPVSMLAAIEKLGFMPQGRKIAVLGEMLELGKDSDRFHADLAQPLITSKIAKVIMLGENMRALADVLDNKLEYIYYDIAENANIDWHKTIASGDVILFKGSHGSGVYKLVQRLKQYSQQYSNQFNGCKN